MVDLTSNGLGQTVNGNESNLSSRGTEELTGINVLKLTNIDAHWSQRYALLL